MWVGRNGAGKGVVKEMKEINGWTEAMERMKISGFGMGSAASCGNMIGEGWNGSEASDARMGRG